MDRDWPGQAKRLLRTEMTRRNMTHDDLVKRLAEIGVAETNGNVRNKLHRGQFSAIFLLQCLTAMGVTTLRLDEDQ